jgi:hypothetical protein
MIYYSNEQYMVEIHKLSSAITKQSLRKNKLIFEVFKLFFLHDTILYFSEGSQKIMAQISNHKPVNTNNGSCRGFVNRSAIGVGIWRFVEGGEHGGAIQDGGSTSLPSFRSRNGGEILRAAIIHYKATSARLQ